MQRRPMKLQQYLTRHNNSAAMELSVYAIHTESAQNQVSILPAQHTGLRFFFRTTGSTELYPVSNEHRQRIPTGILMRMGGAKRVSILHGVNIPLVKTKHTHKQTHGSIPTQKGEHGKRKKREED